MDVGLGESDGGCSDRGKVLLLITGGRRGPAIAVATAPAEPIADVAAFRLPVSPLRRLSEKFIAAYSI